MPETLDEQNQELFNLSRALDVARRRYYHFLIPMFVGWLVVWGASWLLSPRYKSTTLILVQQPAMPANLVPPNVNGDLQDRLQSISQQILSRTRLLTIIADLHLYADNAKASDDDKVERMRKDIGIDLVRDVRNQEINAFRISYTAPNAKVAQDVTKELSSLFINENLRMRQSESESTTQFIGEQLDAASKALAEQEAKVRAFQSQHMGGLPTQQASNLQILGGLQSQLQSEQDALNTAKQQRVYLQALAEQNKPVKSALPHSTDPAVAALDQQIGSLRSQLTDLSARYTSKYPDVVRMKDQIARLEKQRAELAAASPVHSADSPAGADTAYAQIQGQIRANHLEIGNRERAIAGLQSRIGDYQSRLNGAPATEQQLAELTRGYDQSKANYDDLLKKKNESAMATSMELTQQGARFGILDPASLPAKPDFPDRLKFFLYGLVCGVLLGVVVATVTEWMDDRMYDEAEIKALLSVPVISEIPVIASPLDSGRAKRSQVLRWVATGAVFLFIIAGAAVSFLHA
jgi:polysaccharide biosynthesis transport protein